MIETITIITLSVLFLIFFRPGKTPPLDNPLVIERPGNYHMTLAPQLNLAQPFIEAIAKQIGISRYASEYSSMQCFEVSDKSVTSHGQKSFLLTITLLNGMLYFHAASPRSGELTSDNPEIRKFNKSVIERIHVTGGHSSQLDDLIVNATLEVAQKRNVQAKQLTH